MNEDGPHVKGACAEVFGSKGGWLRVVIDWCRCSRRSHVWHKQPGREGPLHNTLDKDDKSDQRS